MDSNPRHLVHAREFILVIRLMLMENDGEIESIIHFTRCRWLNHWKLIRRGCIVDVLDVPCMGERFGSVVACWILLWERRPNIPFVLPLSIDNDVQRGWRAEFRPRESKLCHHISFPSRIEFDNMSAVNPCTSIVGNESEVGIILENKSIICSEWKGVGKAPILTQNRTLC